MRSPLHLRKHPRGFTLIEVTLAVALLATIVMLTWGTISTSFRVRRTTLDKFERFRTVQQAMDRMAREISMAFLSDPAYELPDSQGNVSYRTIFEGDDDSITFTSLSHVRALSTEAGGDQSEITFRLDDQRGEDGDIHHNLVRREDAPIDDDPEEGGVLFTMLPDVERITFEYWDPTRDIAGEAWVRQWDAGNDHAGLLPTRVRITIEIKHPTRQNDEISFSTQTEIHLTEPLRILPTDIQEDLDTLRQTLLGLDGTEDPSDSEGN